MKIFLLGFLIPFYSFSQITPKGFNLENAINLPVESSSSKHVFDSEGNIYFFCDFAGSINIGAKILKSTYGIAKDKLLIKFNSKYEILWAHAISTISNNAESSIAIDLDNNIYVAGNYDNKSFQFGNYSLMNNEKQSGKNIFLMKFNTNGEVAWAHTLGGKGDDFCTSIKTDKNNNIIITGNYSDELVFDSLLIKTNGNADIFVAKYDTNGKFKWAKTFGGEGEDFSKGLATDANDNIYITGGFFSSEILLENNKLENDESTNRSDNSKIIIAKFDSNGNSKWAKTSSGFAITMGNSICISEKNEVFVAGFFLKSDVIFETKTVEYHNQMGQNNALFLKFSEDGNILWAQSSSNECLSNANSVAVDNIGYVYFLGNFSSQSIQFGNQQDSLSLIKNTTQGREDIFIAKFDSKGVFMFANKIGGVYDDWGTYLTANKQGLIISGVFQSSELFLINRGPLKKFNTDERYSSAFLCKLWSLHESIPAANTTSKIEDSIASIQEIDKIRNDKIRASKEIIGIFQKGWGSSGDELWSADFKGEDGKDLYFLLADELDKSVFCDYQIDGEEKTVKENVGKKYKIHYTPIDNGQSTLGEIISVEEIK